jgi:ribosomal protein L37E
MANARKAQREHLSAWIVDRIAEAVESGEELVYLSDLVSESHDPCGEISLAEAAMALTRVETKRGSATKRKVLAKVHQSCHRCGKLTGSTRVTVCSACARVCFEKLKRDGVIGERE